MGGLRGHSCCAALVQLPSGAQRLMSVVKDSAAVYGGL